MNTFKNDLLQWRNTKCSILKTRNEQENKKGQHKHLIWQSDTRKIEQQGSDGQAAAASKQTSTYGKNNNFSSNALAFILPHFSVNLQNTEHTSMNREENEDIANSGANV